MKRFTKFLPVLFILIFSCKTPLSLPAKKESIGDIFWTLENMRRKEIKFDDYIDEISIQFNLESGMFSGSSGCNRYLGKFSIHGDNLTILGHIGSTKMACFQELMTLENTYLNTLKSVNKYQITNGKLLLFQNEQATLIFSPEVKIK